MGKAKKNREQIPSETAARTLFLADRTCCVCRGKGKPVQIHHIDENPANNDLRNHAVLCFDCHRETQIHGGFDRKLDADQVILYRDDWNRIVARGRVTEEAVMRRESADRTDIEQITSIAEIYRENGNFELLAIHYDVIGNKELRDKYIDIALSKSPSDDTVVFLRGLQGRLDLIPQEVVDREDQRLIASKDWLQRARMLTTLNKHREAVTDYLQGILKSLSEDRVFSAAFYLRELSESNLLEELFVFALKNAREDGDLWWQVRALQELAWQSELDELLIENEDEILNSDNLELMRLLAISKGNHNVCLNLEKEIAIMESKSEDQYESEKDGNEVSGETDDQS